MARNSPTQLGDLLTDPFSFPHLQEVMEELSQEDFSRCNEMEQIKKASEKLLDLIDRSSEEEFLLPAVVEYFSLLQKKEIFSFAFTFFLFELWLNEFSSLSQEENRYVRGRIMGKWIPRGEYQVFFPVGMNHQYEGPHFVSAHRSPDIDTTIASFWGWVDAFSAPISKGRHVWNLPEGEFPGHIHHLFEKLFGGASLSLLPRRKDRLNVSAIDLITQRGFVKKRGYDTTRDIMHESGSLCFILTDDKGYYLNDWRTSDVEGVRWVIFLFTSCLHWMADYFHLQFIALFSQKKLIRRDVDKFFHQMLAHTFKDAAPAKELLAKDLSLLDSCLKSILFLKEGVDSSFSSLFSIFLQMPSIDFPDLQVVQKKLLRSELFDAEGTLKENRPLLFASLQEVVSTLDGCIQKIRTYFERLDVSIHIKEKVLHIHPNYLLPGDDLEEIHRKMQNHLYLVVVYPSEKDRRLIPLGIVRAKNIRKETLGTVSFRDFCNTKEMEVPPYLEIISVVDHHKMEVRTTFPPSALVGDVQSSNVLLAEQNMRMNEKYALNRSESLDKQWKSLQENLQKSSLPLGHTAQTLRVMQKQIQRQHAEKQRGKYFVTAKREIAEYLSFLYAIFDDTDLLQKVSDRDVICVAQIINRLKSIQEGSEREILHFDDISPDEEFARKAAHRILTHRDVYSLYKKIYDFRERELTVQIEQAAERSSFAFFSDTKEQNGCARIGQTKIFSSNYSVFTECSEELRNIWLQRAQEVSASFPQLCFHLHMISTIRNAEETYQSEEVSYSHRDEIWIWIEESPQGMSALQHFLRSFSHEEKLAKIAISLTLIGSQLNTEKFASAIANSSLFFADVLRTIDQDSSTTLLLFQFQAGTLNSRKAMITPYLPSL